MCGVFENAIVMQSHGYVDSEHDVFLHRFQNYFVSRFNVFVSDFYGTLALTLPGHTAPGYPFVRVIYRDHYTLLLYLIFYFCLGILLLFFCN